MEREHFEALTRAVLDRLPPGEDATIHLRGERSEFVRLNHGKIRQAGTVTQEQGLLRRIRGDRHASAGVTLGGRDLHDDVDRFVTAMHGLDDVLDVVPPDPHLRWCQEEGTTVEVQQGGPAPAESIITSVVEHSAGLDLVGLLTAGPLWTGFASSRGLQRWDERHGWLLDFSVVQGADRAIKSTLAGTEPAPDTIAARIEEIRSELPLLAIPPRRLEPGRYRAWLAPAAVAGLLGMVKRGGLSRRATETAQSPLMRLIRGECALSEQLTITEDTAGGWGPAFTSDGFALPDRVPLIEGGELVGTLTSPRSAQEYGVPGNSGPGEYPNALVMQPGTLPTSEALAALGTGLWISNLWYLNFSDRPAGRITGMTRFTTLWVEDGRVVCPVEVLRFDDTLYHLLGAGLEHLSDTAELLPSTVHFERRSTASDRVPGALIDAITFTL
ncbi:MAG TPA: hypothetical protein ENK18_18820 [Deltaproteobacteria bacterium]|nr:hypothetical protein [Deltaproteobacteria bacterium]